MKHVNDRDGSCSGMGVQIGDETTIYTLYSADQQVVMAHDPDDLEFIMKRLMAKYEQWVST